METSTETPKTNVGKPITNINVSRIIMGLTEIGNLEIEDFSINMGISKSITNLTTVEKSYAKTMQTLMKKHIQKDEKGNLMSANGFYIFNTEKDKEEYQDAVDKLNDTVITEKVWTIKATDLAKLKGIKGTTLAKCHELIIDDIPENK